MDQKDLETTVARHEERLDSHDTELHNLRKEFHETLGRVDEINKFLREQNNHILEAVINRNNNADRRDYALQSINAKNRWKLWLQVLSASGIVSILLALIERVFELLFKK